MAIVRSGRGDSPVGFAAPSGKSTPATCLLALGLLSWASGLGGLRGTGFAAEAGAQEPLTFESDIQPILKAHCFHCHGEEPEVAGGLDLRLRTAIVRGGESGPAVVLGKPGDSLLWERVAQGEMPPEDVEQRPTKEELERLRRWIAEGARFTGPEPESLPPGPYISPQERAFWAFQPPRKAAPPAVRQPHLVETPVDQFLLARLEAVGQQFAPPVDRARLIRRVSLDLTGLPPAPERVAAFVADASPDAYQRLLDELLDSPHYGERWGRHWLDVAGYADSEGPKEDDPIRPWAYKYRDYVIASFNRDKPIDQFLREQLAGDEMIDHPLKNLSPQETEWLTATGFLRMGVDETTGAADQGVARNQVIADTLQIVSTSILGLTVHCAQCHSHRYDPIPQADYYRLRALLEPAYDWKNWLPPAKRRVSLLTDSQRQRGAELEQEAAAILAERSKRQAELVEQVFRRELEKVPAEIRESVAAARNTAVKQRTEQQQELLRKYPAVNVTAGSLSLYDRNATKELAEFTKRAEQVRAQKPREEFVRALYEPGNTSEPPATYVFHRGDHEQPKEVVAPSELSVLVPLDGTAPAIPGDDPRPGTSGRRLAYARWLTSGAHPLTARVFVNRVWAHHFGRGIVATPGDFGFLGARPTHPELLDWLSVWFVEQGWSLKRLHRLLLSSRAYLQTTAHRPELDQVDPENHLLGRMNLARLDAETLRDSLLALGGALNTRRFGPPVPVMADRVGQFVIGIENLNAGRPGPVIPMKGEDLRRSVYVQVRRSRPLGILDTFDAPKMEPNCCRRTASTVTPQALLLMNSPQVIGHAERIAARVEREAGPVLQAQAERAWELVYNQPVPRRELDAAETFLREMRDYYRQHPVGASDPKASSAERDSGAAREALRRLCHALVSSNRFLYME